MPLPGHRVRIQRSLPVRLAPLGIFAVLASVTVLVWRDQVNHQRDLLRRHTEDVCVQAARRLEVRLESRLRVASIFAQRWATHETRDFSQKRFSEFASLLVRELPAYHSVHLIGPEAGVHWRAPRHARSAWPKMSNGRTLLNRSLESGEMVLSAPVSTVDSSKSFFAVIPMNRGHEFIGHLVVEFRSEKLIGDVFHERIRSEFDFQVKDAGTILYRYARRPDVLFSSAPIRADKRFEIRNRSWSLTIVPRRQQSFAADWMASLSVPLLGVALSIGLSMLVHMLSRRIVLYRAARDTALSEIAERERAEEAMQVSEARYRSVFNSATDGLIVIDDNDCIVEANPAASLMHGFKPGDIIGRHYADFIDPDHRHLFDEFKRQLSQYGSVRLDSVHVSSDGVPLDVEVRGTSFSFGDEPRVLAILTDVSERKKAILQQATLSRKVLMAQEEERSRVSRDLHDELGQVLTALHLELDWLHRKNSSQSEETASEFNRATAMVEEAADELRRICRGLRPQLLDDLGLEPAVRQLVEEFEERTRIRTTLDVQLQRKSGNVSREIGLCAYRILQEALNNVGRHADASGVSISLNTSDGSLLLSVYDDGQGFNPKDASSAGGYGIAGMRERTSLVNGTIDIRSEPYQGTRIVLRIPLKEPGPEALNVEDPSGG